MACVSNQSLGRLIDVFMTTGSEQLGFGRRKLRIGEVALPVQLSQLGQRIGVRCPARLGTRPRVGGRHGGSVRDRVRVVLPAPLQALRRLLPCGNAPKKRNPPERRIAEAGFGVLSAGSMASPA
jgi:hypothetical protein